MSDVLGTVKIKICIHTHKYTCSHMCMHVHVNIPIHVCMNYNNSVCINLYKYTLR